MSDLSWVPDDDLAAYTSGRMQDVSDATLNRLNAENPPEKPVEPDMSKLKGHFDQNLQNFHEKAAADPTGKPPREAQGFLDAIEAGWQMSVSGLASRQKSPDMVMNEHASTFMNIASQAATLAGDIPAMVVGEVAGASVGAAAGTAVAPIVGTAAGAFAGGAAGAFGLPAAMRHIMMDHYARGDIQTGSEFMERAGSTFIDTAKAAATGILTMGTGKYVGGLTKAAGGMVSSIASKMSEAATMTTVSAAFEGKLPDKKDFTEAALFLGGLHMVHALPSKLMDIYAKTGVTPMEVIGHAEADPVVKQQLLSGNEIPQMYEEIHQQDLNLQPKAPDTQDGFNLDPPVAPTANERRLEMAKRFDPKAFEAQDSVEKRLSDLGDQRLKLEDERAKIESDMKEHAAVPDVAAATRESGQAALQAKLDANTEALSSVNKDLDRAIGGSEKIQSRVNKAYDSVKPLVEATTEELKLKTAPEHALNKLADEYANKEFVTPETTMEIKDPHAQSEMDLGVNDQMAFLNKEHPETAKVVQAKSAEVKASKYSTAEQKMEAMIGTAKEPEADPFFSKNMREKFRTDWIDGLHAITARTKDLTKGEKLDPISDPVILTARANAHTGMVARMYKFGVFDYNDFTKQTSRGFAEIVGDDHTDAMKLKFYMMAERGIEIENQGKNAGSNFDRASAEQVVTEGRGKYAERAKELVGFQNEVLRYLKDSGFFSDEQYKAITDTNDKYLPWNRIDPKRTQKGGAQFKSKTKPIKELLGSDKDIQDPFVSILKNTDMYVRLAEQQRAKRAFVELNLKAPEDDRFIKEVNTGIAVKEGDAVDQITTNISESRVSKSGDNYQFTLVDDGKTRTFETSKEIYEAYEALGGNKSAAGTMSKMMRGITQIKRAGISLTPEFMIKNVIRDYQTAGAFVEGGMFSPKELAAAVADIHGETKVYKDYLASGGAHSTVMEFSQDFVDRQLGKLEEKTGVWDLGWSTVRNAKDKLAGMAELSEEMTRVAAFKRKAGATPDTNSLLAGGHASKEATVDFSKVGAKMAAFRAITAFQGAQIQGADRYIRALTTDFKGTATRSALTISLPTLLLWAATRDDERLAELPDYQRNQAFTIPINHWQKAADPKELAGVPAHSKRQDKEGNWEINNGPIIRVPMSQEGGLVFGALLRKSLEKMDKNNRAGGDDLAKQILSAFTPTVVPDVAVPALETFFDKSLFTGNKLVPYHLEGELPEHIYTPYTSELAKGLGKVIAAVPEIPLLHPTFNSFNPVVIDNWIKSWTGTLGTYALGMMDGAFHGIQSASEISTKPDQTITGAIAESADKVGGFVSALTLADVPVVKAFVFRYPSMGMQPIQDFYEKSKEAQGVAKTVEDLMGRQDLAGAQKVIEKHRDLYFMAKPMKEAQAAIGKMSTAIKAIDASTSMKALDKRHLIDGLYYQISGVSKGMITQMGEAKNKVAETSDNALP